MKVEEPEPVPERTPVKQFLNVPGTELLPRQEEHHRKNGRRGLVHRRLHRLHRKKKAHNAGRSAGRGRTLTKTNGEVPEEIATTVSRWNQRSGAFLAQPRG